MCLSALTNCDGKNKTQTKKEYNNKQEMRIALIFYHKNLISPFFWPLLIHVPPFSRENRSLFVLSCFMCHMHITFHCVFTILIFSTAFLNVAFVSKLVFSLLSHKKKWHSVVFNKRYMSRGMCTCAWRDQGDTCIWTQSLCMWYLCMTFWSGPYEYSSMNIWFVLLVELLHY